jgi:hypothetical protein
VGESRGEDGVLAMKKMEKGSREGVLKEDGDKPKGEIGE